jgi:hypothetical protein
MPFVYGVIRYFLLMLGLLNLYDIFMNNVGKIEPIADTVCVHSPALTLLGASTELSKMPTHNKIILDLYLIRSNHSTLSDIQNILLRHSHKDKNTFLKQMFNYLKIEPNSKKSAKFLFRCNNFINTLVMMHNDLTKLDRIFPFEKEFDILDRILFLICNKNYPEYNEL